MELRILFAASRRLHVAGIIAGVFATLPLLAGCAGRSAEGASPAASRPPPVARPSENGPADCFYIRDVQDFRTLSRSDLVVFAPTDRHAYQVRIAPPATSLRFSDSVAFVSRSNRICGFAGDDLVVQEAGGAQRYSVVEVARLSPETVARLLDRKEADAPAPATRPEGGAAVERELEPPAAPATPAVPGGI